MLIIEPTDYRPDMDRLIRVLTSIASRPDNPPEHKAMARQARAIVLEAKRLYNNPATREQGITLYLGEETV